MKTLLVDFSRFLWFFSLYQGVFESKFPVFDTIRRVCAEVFTYFIRGAWEALYSEGMKMNSSRSERTLFDQLKNRSAAA